MSMKIRRYSTYELWDIPPGELLLTLTIEKQPEWGDTPYAVLDEDRDILATHPTFAAAVADVTARLVARQAQETAK